MKNFLNGQKNVKKTRGIKMNIVNFVQCYSNVFSSICLVDEIFYRSAIRRYGTVKTFGTSEYLITLSIDKFDCAKITIIYRPTYKIHMKKYQLYEDASNVFNNLAKKYNKEEYEKDRKIINEVLDDVSVPEKLKCC